MIIRLEKKNFKKYKQRKRNKTIENNNNKIIGTKLM